MKKTWLNSRSNLIKISGDQSASVHAIKWTSSVENDLGVGIQLSINQKRVFLSCRSASVLGSLLASRST